MPPFTATDHLLMAHALRLAERAAWTTRPNPMVGCVIAHGDEVVGEGWHQRAGGPHAEVFALRAAGERARGQQRIIGQHRRRPRQDGAGTPLQADGRFDLPAVMALLAARGINEVHVEAGPTLCGALLQAGLVDELLLYIAPLLMGDTARPLLAGLGIEAMAQAVPLEIADTRLLGKDLRLLLRPVG
jgi:riboflavin biosynthesis pyrimidine reductase